MDARSAAAVGLVCGALGALFAAVVVGFLSEVGSSLMTLTKKEIVSVSLHITMIHGPSV